MCIYEYTTRKHTHIYMSSPHVTTGHPCRNLTSSSPTGMADMTSTRRSGRVVFWRYVHMVSARSLCGKASSG